MSLLEQRAPTTETEHASAVAAAEQRLGRQLTVSEKRIDIVGIDRDLAAGKQALRQAVAAEQRRAAEAFARDGTPIQLRVTAAMRKAISDLYDAGADHARRELEAAGITPA
jgi:hypothetical protein